MTASNTAPQGPPTIGIDVGGTFTKLVAMTASGEVVARARAATNAFSSTSTTATPVSARARATG